MAKIVDQHLGRLRGKIGDIVLKIRDGKSYVARAPKPYKKTTKECAIANRDKFAMMVKFSKVVNESDVLKPLWKKSDFKGKTAYSKISSAISPNIGANHIGILAAITPTELTLGVKKVILDASNFQVEFTAVKSIFKKFTLPFSAIGIIHLSHPKNNSITFHKFITIEEYIVDLDLNYNNSNDLSFSIGKNLLNIVNDYEMIVVFFALVSYPEYKDPISACAAGFVVKGQDIMDSEISETNRISNTKVIKKTPKDLNKSDVIIRIT